MAWFFLLRGRVGELFSSLPAVYRGPVDSVPRLEKAQALPYSSVELRTQFGAVAAQPEANTRPALTAEKVGERMGFWVTDGAEGETYWVTATLRYAGEHTLIYVDNTIGVDQQAIEQAARDFETHIYPQTRALFGPETPSAFDGDGHLTILHTPLQTAAGYFSLPDRDPLEVNRFSNQRDMFVISSNSFLPGDDGYLMILAHEFQHMIHASHQPASPAWFNEGMSMLAQDLNGYIDDELALIYLENPDISLIDWAQDASVTGEHYGAAQLFLRYFHQQYGRPNILLDLLSLNAGSNTQVFVRLAAEKRLDVHRFVDLVADWAVANLVNDPAIGDGRYAYEGLPAQATPLQFPGRQVNATVNQLGVDYLEVGNGPRWLAFDGGDAVALTGARPEQGSWMWWSGRGDSRVATLTRRIDLRNVTTATLEFST